MKRLELAKYTITGAEERLLVRIYTGEGEPVIETIKVRLIAFNDDSHSLAENQSAALRCVASLLSELANQIYPAHAE